MHRLSRIAALIVGLVIGSPSHALLPHIAGQEAFVSRAVFADGRLWLLTDDGELSSIVEHQERREAQAFPEPVHDLCLRERKPTVVTCAREHCRDWSVRQFEAGQWSVKATARTERGEEMVALACGEPTTTLLTSTRLLTLGKQGTIARPLTNPFVMRGVTTTWSTAAGLLVGRNVGEWGGGLMRIDRNTGEVHPIERQTGDALCSGPLNTNCDPVNAITSVPWHPKCVAAAIGLVHFFPKGRIVEVCGDDVKSIYFEPYHIEGFKDQPPDENGEPPMTLPFFGLVRHGDVLWAVGGDALYRVTQNGAEKVETLGEYREIDGIQVNFDSPDFVLVLTRINQRHSISGAAPMLVARDSSP